MSCVWGKCRDVNSFCVEFNAAQALHAVQQGGMRFARAWLDGFPEQAWVCHQEINLICIQVCKSGSIESLGAGLSTHPRRGYNHGNGTCAHVQEQLQSTPSLNLGPGHTWVDRVYLSVDCSGGTNIPKAVSCVASRRRVHKQRFHKSWGWRGRLGEPGREVWMQVSARGTSWKQWNNAKNWSFALRVSAL